MIENAPSLRRSRASALRARGLTINSTPTRAPTACSPPRIWGQGIHDDNHIIHSLAWHRTQQAHRQTRAVSAFRFAPRALTAGPIEPLSFGGGGFALPAQFSLPLRTTGDGGPVDGARCGAVGEPDGAPVGWTAGLGLALGRLRGEAKEEGLRGEAKTGGFPLAERGGGGGGASGGGDVSQGPRACANGGHRPFH